MTADQVQIALRINDLDEAFVRELRRAGANPSSVLEMSVGELFEACIRNSVTVEPCFGQPIKQPRECQEMRRP